MVRLAGGRLIRIFHTLLKIKFNALNLRIHGMRVQVQGRIRRSISDRGDQLIIQKIRTRDDVAGGGTFRRSDGHGFGAGIRQDFRLHASQPHSRNGGQQQTAS